MRILFDSKKSQFKTPFGCLTPKQSCRLQIHIPATVKTTGVDICLTHQDGTPLRDIPMSFEENREPYHIWAGDFSLEEAGLYFYYFRITGHTGTFRLFKQGNDTNMEAGDTWQISCIPADFTTPDWAKGATIYQIFPDRFHKAGDCDLTGKLQPYVLHENWMEEVFWQPTPEGVVLNNDFYGGNFQGISQKLDYIASLGTTILYLNPISKSFSSHRYDTGDYKTPDPMLGTEADFAKLCEEAHNRGIRVILDGVFSHTGADSLYFDKKGSFGGKGAYASPQSPFYNWYRFAHYPDSYDSWWGFDTLPTVNKLDDSFIRYIITDQDSVLAHWIMLGADGFRLDVADELPAEFLKLLKIHLRRLKPDALLIGEVWEDASNKIAHNKRCRYFTDGVLDSVMNYPFRSAILRFVRGEDDGQGLESLVMTILENYPPQVIPCNMNILGTHDTPRILTALVDDFEGDREALAQRKLSPAQRELSRKRLLCAAVLQFTLPGTPSLYYGDEAGMEGGKDPFNRRPYPWGQEDELLRSHFRMLGQLRQQKEELRTGHIQFLHARNGQLGYQRVLNGQAIRIYVNQSNAFWDIPAGKLLLGYGLDIATKESLRLQPMGCCIVE